MITHTDIAVVRPSVIMGCRFYRDRWFRFYPRVSMHVPDEEDFVARRKDARTVHRG